MISDERHLNKSGPTTGFILAAGEGRRLRPATFVRPKALVPLEGIPLLEVTWQRLEDLPLQSIVVNASYLGDIVEAAARALAADNSMPLFVSRENELLGTGGGLRQGLELVPVAESILVHNVDVILDFDLDALISRYRSEPGVIGVLLMVPGQGPCTVAVAEDGEIENFRLGRGAGQYTFSGVHIFHRRLLKYLPDQPVCSVVDAYEAAQRDGWRVIGMSTESAYWSDLGTTPAYLDAHYDTRERRFEHIPCLGKAAAEQQDCVQALATAGVVCTGTVTVGSDVEVAAGSHLHNCVLWDGAKVAAPRHLFDGIITGGEIGASPALTAERQPDPRILRTLRVEPEQCTLTPLTRQGSGRLYRRLQYDDESWVWCAYNEERPENAGFAGVARFLADHSVPVPEVLVHLPDKGEILMSDLGDQSLLGVKPGPERQRHLTAAAVSISRLHLISQSDLMAGDASRSDPGLRPLLDSRDALRPGAAARATVPLQPPFRDELYDWERDYFRTWILGHMLDRPELWEAAAADYAEVREVMLAQPLVPVHRDLQSANIMIHTEKPFFIDFQGLRLGAAVYDLASLLYDPYASYPAAVRGKAWQSYCEAIEAAGGKPPALAALHAAAVQRLLQALGAFGKLWRQDGLEWYAQFIGPGLKMLETAAQEHGRWQGIGELAKGCLS
jgi:NDP-sugar pyrophosphorylase family protein/aminoglycoside/choline kinase family phosphotransferase